MCDKNIHTSYKMASTNGAQSDTDNMNGENSFWAGQ
jgi:hypothetical protein